MDGKQAEPAGETEHAIYADSIARYKAKLDKKAGTAADGKDAQEEVPPFSAATLIAMPADRRFSALCTFTPAELKTLRRTLLPDERQKIVTGFTPQQFEALVAFETPSGLVEAEDVQTKLLRDMYTERQVNEVMVDFWLNHFNVYMKKSQEEPYYIASYVRDAIRPYALGRFENLLVATASSPAMLQYLDNSASVGPNSPFAQKSAARADKVGQKKTGLNENYARELMELHTLGVNGGYTQKDVSEVAKVFTGWTVGSPERGGTPVEAQYDEKKHEPGSKTVLGVTIKENGEREGLEVLHLLANSPQTARFISTKLAIRFVSDDPPSAMIDRMAKTFLSSHGDIRKVLLAMVNSPEFFSRATYRAKIKTPQDFVVSVVRASGADVQSAGALANVIEELGMPVYGMQTPNGYSMRSEEWNSTSALIGRLNFALALSTNRVGGVKIHWNALLSPTEEDSGSPSNTQAREAALEKVLLNMPASDRTRETIAQQVSSDPAQQQASLRQIAIKDRKRDLFAVRPTEDKVQVDDPSLALAAGLLFGSPEFQRR